MTPAQFEQRLAKARVWWSNQQAPWWKTATEEQRRRAFEVYGALEDCAHILEWVEGWMKDK